MLWPLLEVDVLLDLQSHHIKRDVTQSLDVLLHPSCPIKYKAERSLQNTEGRAFVPKKNYHNGEKWVESEHGAFLFPKRRESVLSPAGGAQPEPN